jgi:hypothetical protein
MKVPGVDLGNVAFDAVAERLTDMSSDVVMFTR